MKSSLRRPSSSLRNSREPLIVRPARRELLALRESSVKPNLMQPCFPDLLAETADLREAEWTVAPIPSDMLDRRVEITGPVDRKMIINPLNSGANVFMADFEDSNSPTWSNVLEGQLNLRDAVRREIRFVSPEGKLYELTNQPAVLFVRPRGWHLRRRISPWTARRFRPASFSILACSSFTMRGS